MTRTAIESPSVGMEPRRGGMDQNQAQPVAQDGGGVDDRTRRAIEDLRAECEPNGQGHFASIMKANGRLILAALHQPAFSEGEGS